MLLNKIKNLADKNHPEVIKLRRHLHQHPELSFQEKETGKYVSEKLKSWGIPNKRGMAGNGVVGILKGKKKNNNIIALRGDMDALPILEANKVSYKSKNEGVMHACGHDVHTSSLLGVAKILNELKDEWGGTIKLIFQPGEETLPGGASIMIKEGVLKNPSPTKILGQHVHPPLSVGKIGMKAGQYMASADEIYVSVKGRGGHGALPHDCIDPVVVTSQIVVALQQIVSRFSNPTTPTVLTFGNIASTGGRTNVIPYEVKLEGTFRTMDEKWRKEAHKRMKKIAEMTAKGMGATCDFDIKVGYPFLVNHEELTAQTRAHAIEYLGKKNVVDLPIRMTAEDFAFFSQKMPATFYRLGTGNKKRGITSPVHTNTFDVDEDCLNLGPGVMAWLAIRTLGN